MNNVARTEPTAQCRVCKGRCNAEYEFCYRCSQLVPEPKRYAYHRARWRWEHRVGGCFALPDYVKARAELEQAIREARNG